MVCPSEGPACTVRFCRQLPTSKVGLRGHSLCTSASRPAVSNQTSSLHHRQGGQGTQGLQDKIKQSRALRRKGPAGLTTPHACTSNSYTKRTAAMDGATCSQQHQPLSECGSSRHVDLPDFMRQREHPLLASGVTHIDRPNDTRCV